MGYGILEIYNTVFDKISMSNFIVYYYSDLECAS
jgi:hypothetical protein